MNYTNAAQGTITALASVVVALMAVVTGVLTAGLIRENRLLRKAGSEPRVVAYLTTHPRHTTMVNLALANIGHGAARNIRFRFDASDEDFRSHNVRLSNKAERTPIGTLPQGEKIEAFFGAGHHLFKQPRLQPFDVHVDYENMAGKPQRSTYRLDVSQFDGLVTLGRPAEQEVAEALKKIERHFGHFASGFRRLKVETITTEAAERAFAEQVNDWREEHNKE